MIQRGENLGFTLEACDAVGIRFHCVGQHLDRHVASELPVVRAVHFAHPALAKQRQHFIGTDLRADSDGHDVAGV